MSPTIHDNPRTGTYTYPRDQDRISRRCWARHKDRAEKQILIPNRGVQKMKEEALPTIDDLRKSPEEFLSRLKAIKGHELYRVLLGVQNELTTGCIVRFLASNEKWKRSRMVLDLGCGPGDLVAKLSGCFIDKLYTGVDLNEDFIATAKQQTKMLSNCTFYQDDIYTFSQGQYNFIILMAVLQHLKIDKFLKHLPFLLDDEGVVLFFDTTKENSIEAHPPLVTFNKFCRRFELMQKLFGVNRNCMAELESKLGAHNFKIIEDQKQIIPITTTVERLQVVQYLLLFCTVAKKMLWIPINFNKILTELLQWYDTPDSRMHLKLQLLLIEKAQSR